LRRAELERRLQLVPPPPKARAELEQYRTPARVATDLLVLADKDGAIRDRNVLDLGCGTGIFAIGAALLGARLATGIDVDADAVAMARETAQAAGVATTTSFVVGDVAAWRADPGVYDTVLMNPPFGAQAANRHADRVFLARAWESVKDRRGAVWFLAQERTVGFLAGYARELGATLEQVAAWDYPLEATMAHHQEEARVVRVAGYRMGP
jgi:putative methylase